MKILVTGGAGFVGSHIVEKLGEEGNELLVIDNLSTGTRENLPRGINFCELDLLSEAAEKQIKEYRPEIVVHAAANASVRKSLKNAISDYENNTLATIKLLLSAHENNKPQVIFFSTAAVIAGEDAPLPLPESSMPSPNTFYGISKYTSEMAVRNICRQFGTNHTIIRPSNIYGPRQKSDQEGGVVSILIERMLNNLECNIFGDGEQTRDFIYVDDISTAVSHIIRKQLAGIFNVSTGKQKSVNQLFNLLKGKLGYTGIAARKDEITGEIRYNSLSNEKLRQTGWDVTTELEEGLEKTINYFKG